MRRQIAVAILLALVLVPGFSQEARFTAVNGKVEIQNSSGAWVPATVNMTVGNQTMISTGFNASATLSVGDSTVQVAQLTRMRFDEISANREGTENTSLYLNVGRVSAEVRSAEGRPQDFRVRSPLSTAAVRGTEFTFDGERLTVRQGVVAFVNALNQRREVARGQETTSDGTSAPKPPQEIKLEQVTISTAPVGAGGESAPPMDVVPQAPRPTTGSVRIQLQ